VHVSAIVLAHGAEPLLVECVSALVAQGVDEVLVVDNEAAREPVAAVAAIPGVAVLRPQRNLGFAGGVNHAAARAGGDVLLVVNSDAVARPGAVAALCRQVADPAVGLACASVRLARDPDRINSVGNPVHYLMFSWAGALGEPAGEHDRPTEVASISGVAFAVRRDVWDRLGGFDPEYFAYCEDVDLSVRAWQAGYRVVHEPTAVVDHDYEVARNPSKRYLLERNRLVNLLLLPERRTRRMLVAPAVGVELGVLALAARDGWLGDKLAGYRWILAHRRRLVARRRVVQAARARADRELAHLFTDDLRPPAALGPTPPLPVNRALAGYWRWASARL
jgi:GT2 family glycosyltransferase